MIKFIGGEVFETVDSDVHADSRDSREMALKTAEKLLKVSEILVSSFVSLLFLRGPRYSAN